MAFDAENFLKLIDAYLEGRNVVSNSLEFVDGNPTLRALIEGFKGINGEDRLAVAQFFKENADCITALFDSHCHELWLVLLQKALMCLAPIHKKSAVEKVKKFPIRIALDSHIGLLPSLPASYTPQPYPLKRPSTSAPDLSPPSASAVPQTLSESTSPASPDLPPPPASAAPQPTKNPSTSASDLPPPPANADPQPLSESTSPASLNRGIAFLKNHWRALLAMTFGVLMVVLAFTPAGPALAAALALKAFFAPVFAWISGIGLWSIALGIGLVFSGFMLAVPSWLLGEALMIVGGALTQLFWDTNWFIRRSWIDLKNEYEQAQGIIAFVLGCAIAFAYVLGAPLYLALTLIQVAFLFLAEVGDDIFRKLGSSLMRKLYHAPPSKVKILSDDQIDQYDDKNPCQTRLPFFASMKADHHCGECHPIEHAIYLRAEYSLDDALMLTAHPYEVQESSSPRPS